MFNLGLNKFVVFVLLALTVSTVFAKETLVVVNRDAAAVQIIDPIEMKVLATVPTGEGPHEVVISADGKTAVVSNYGAQKAGSSLSIIDLETQKETKRVDLFPLLKPHGLVEVNGKIYFTAEVNDLVGRYDLASGKIDWLIGTGQTASHMLVVTPDQKKIYTANVASDTVTAIEFGAVPPAGSKITHIPVGKQPEAIDISPNGKEVWVGLNTENSIQIIDTAQNKAVEKINVGERPYRIRFTPDGKQSVATIPNTKEIAIFDAASRKELKRISLESYPLGLIFSKDGKLAFISTTQGDFVLKIDLEKGEVIGKVETGKASDGIALTGM
ncbi:MAG: YncE family protein [Pyrinomonadaceae bacterium]|nr:YncE family protein [Pyrinomonadaceae bacterium]